LFLFQYPFEHQLPVDVQRDTEINAEQGRPNNAAEARKRRRLAARNRQLSSTPSSSASIESPESNTIAVVAVLARMRTKFFTNNEVDVNELNLTN
jgi:hypothetical protein